ncbi:hypothetical protein NQ318_021133 [Aromia moschata]|uniref:Uncharacterized protein n=1 Tax=Aromia moschata TaxID=1265417 RepID=A0AAV8YGI2_9CUCU|nr:hypothetical protein NQ318_021133 [Aromia moschata]
MNLKLSSRHIELTCAALHILGTHTILYSEKFSRLEGHNVPSLSPVDTGSTKLAPSGSSPDMDDVSSKRQATRVFKKSSPNGKVCNIVRVGSIYKVSCEVPIF